MDARLDGQTAIVTGAAHGFGREISRQLAEAGARVWCCDILAEEVRETAALCGASCTARQLDVTDRSACRAVVEEAAAAGTGVHILVNNAGGVLGQVGRPVEDVSEADWRAIIDVNLNGAFFLAQAVVPHMKRLQTGRIVNISSGAGITVSLTGIQAYAAAKAALLSLTRQLAHELGPFGITVNSIAPGFVRSNPNTERQWQSYGEEGQRRLVESIPLRRLGTAEDIGHAVLFLASGAASYITGEVIRVAGGR